MTDTLWLSFVLMFFAVFTAAAFGTFYGALQRIEDEHVAEVEDERRGIKARISLLEGDSDHFRTGSAW